MAGRGKSAKTLGIIDDLLRFYVENQPAGVRAACYWLFVRALIASMKKNNTSRIRHILARAREDAVEIERAETESMQGFLTTWNSSISGQATKYSAGAA